MTNPQLADVVTINDLGGMLGIVETVHTYDDPKMTVMGVRSITGQLYAREPHEVEFAGVRDTVEFFRDLRILAKTHPELRAAVQLLDDRGLIGPTPTPVHVDSSNARDLVTVGARLRAGSMVNPALVLAEGRIIGSCPSPTVMIQLDDGTTESWSTDLPMHIINR